MIEDIYDPLNEYISTFKEKFKQVADETFNALADEAQVDVEANRETCRQIYAGEKKTHGCVWSYHDVDYPMRHSVDSCGGRWCCCICEME